MFEPKYEITNRLVKFIADIHSTAATFAGNKAFGTQLAKFTSDARALSSHTSTSIEGNPLALTDVKQLLKQSPKHARDSEKEILNYNQALEETDKKIKSGDWKLTPIQLTATQKTITKDLLQNPFHIGKLRNEQVVIRDPRSDSIIFIPPNHKDVPQLLKELCKFISDNKEKIDPLILAGIFHRQFVIIHPYMDGNGRTARIATANILAASKLKIGSVFSFENYYNQNVTKYFNAVGMTGDYYENAAEIEHTQWLEYFCEGILDELARIRTNLQIQKTKNLGHLNTILDYIDLHGSINQTQYGNITNRSLAARKKDFNKLIEAQLIIKIGQGKNTEYQKPNN